MVKELCAPIGHRAKLLKKIEELKASEKLMKVLFST